MVITDLQNQFKATASLSEEFISLMQSSFQFYSELCSDFFKKLPSNVQNQALSEYLKNELSVRLFDDNYCTTLEQTKKKFLAENIKLEQFQEKTNYNADILNDLEKLRKVSDEIYQLLQHHWELYKYKRSFVDGKTLIDFVLEIDRIGISWDSYLENYLAVTKILKIASNSPTSATQKLVELKYHIPENEKVGLNIIAEFTQFLKLSYEFILSLHKTAPETELEVFNITVLNPVHCSVLVPNELSESFSRFMHYLSVDVIKKDTLLKFVMEVLRLQEGQEVSKQALTNFQKKLSKQLDALHPQGYIEVDGDYEKDSVEILRSLCADMDELKIQYKDLLVGSNQVLARNRVRKGVYEERVSESTKTKIVVPSKSAEDSSTAKEEFSRKIDPQKIEPDRTLKYSSNSSESPKPSSSKQETSKNSDQKPKVDISRKEHIGFLTS